MTKSIVGEGGTSFAGPDAVALYRAMAIRNAIGLYLKTGMKANRAYTPTNMRAAAGQITGKSYRGRSGLIVAEADLTECINSVKTAMPVVWKWS